MSAPLRGEGRGGEQSNSDGGGEASLSRWDWEVGGRDGEWEGSRRRKATGAEHAETRTDAVVRSGEPDSSLRLRNYGVMVPPHLS